MITLPDALARQQVITLLDALARQRSWPRVRTAHPLRLTGGDVALYRQAALKATEDVENAFMALSQTEARRQELQDEVASLTRARDLSERAYKAGAITLTDVLDADRQLLVARDDLDSTRADAARAAVSAFRALGGGWDLPSNPRVASDAPTGQVPPR